MALNELPRTAKGARLYRLAGIHTAQGHCFGTDLPDDAPDGDDVLHNHRSGLRMFEDDYEIGPGHTLHDTIAQKGSGAFSHWGRQVYFSSTDGTDPRSNGRAYHVLYDPGVSERDRDILSAALAVKVDRLSAEERYAWGERAFSAFVPEVKLSEHARSFFNDDGFRADYERFERANYRSYDRKFAMKELAKLALILPGDFAECGVFRGASAFLLAKGIASGAPQKRLHLFDSFAGLSEPGVRDGHYWQAGALSSNLAEVESNLVDHMASIELHPGWIPQRFADVGHVRFAFVHIDVDLYQPTRDSLEFFGARMVPGGVIVCDDYGFDTCPGARAAVDEYLLAQKRHLSIVHLPTGQGVIFVPGASR